MANLKFNVKKIINNGNVRAIMHNSGFKTLSNPDNTFSILHNDMLYPVIVTTTMIKVGNSSLEAFLNQNEMMYNFLQQNAGIFEDTEEIDLFYEKVYDYTSESIENSVMIGENVYRFNGKYFEIFDKKEAGDFFSELYEKTFTGGFPPETKINQAVEHFYRRCKKDCKEKNFKISTIGTRKKVALAFEDGTLYLEKGFKEEFKENYWNKEDGLFFGFKFNYKNIEGNGIVKRWFNEKFKKGEKNGVVFDDTYVVKALFSDLFITDSDSQVMLFIHGKAGAGKSLLQNLITNSISSKGISNLNFNDLNDKFATRCLFGSIINLSSEITKKLVDSSRAKTAISRDMLRNEAKGVDSLAGFPTAKWIGIGNSLPRIDSDDGIQRRLKNVRISDKMITEHNGEILDIGKFAKYFYEDFKGLIDVLKEGIEALFHFDFNCNDLFNEFANKESVKDFVELNDPFVHFLNNYTEKVDRPCGVTLITIVKAFNTYKSSALGCGVREKKATTLKEELINMGYDYKRLSYRIEGEDTPKKTPAIFVGLTFKEDVIKDLIEDDILFPVIDVDKLKRPLVHKEKPEPETNFKPESKRQLSEEELNVIFEEQELGF